MHSLTSKMLNHFKLLHTEIRNFVHTFEDVTVGSENMVVSITFRRMQRKATLRQYHMVSLKRRVIGWKQSLSAAGKYYFTFIKDDS
jgi:hypothetical protein